MILSYQQNFTTLVIISKCYSYLTQVDSTLEIMQDDKDLLLHLYPITQTTSSFIQSFFMELLTQLVPKFRILLTSGDLFHRRHHVLFFFMTLAITITSNMSLSTFLVICSTTLSFLTLLDPYTPSMMLFGCVTAVMIFLLFL